ncbi:MAG: hypothetical protein R6X20_16040 [Phycisphaerae bacterium]
MRVNHHAVWLVAIAALVVVMAPAGAVAQEEDQAKAGRRAIEDHDPDRVDPNLIKGEDWTFDFQFEHPHPIVVQTPGGEREVYWYLVYTVTNRSNEARNFVPAFTLYTDQATVRRAGMFPRVYEAIKANRKIRFLGHTSKLHTKIMPGEGNARTGVAIFAPLDRETDRFTIFCEGLSGRYIERPNLKAAADAPEDEKVVRLRKAIALSYKLPGDKWWLNLDQPTFLSKEWTWR